LLLFGFMSAGTQSANSSNTGSFGGCREMDERIEGRWEMGVESWELGVGN